MAEFSLLGTMDNKASPLVMQGLIQTLCLNGEVTRAGHFAKRRAIATAVSGVTTFGSSAPYRIFRWTDRAGVSALVAAGSDMACFVNPVNGYLYVRGTGHTAGSIYNNPASMGAAWKTAWGLNAPGTTLPTTDRTTANSRMLGGGYAYVMTYYDQTRNVESPPCAFLTSTTATAENGTQLQWCAGPSQQVTFVAYNPSSPETNASHLRIYRVRILTFPRSSSGWYALPADPLGFTGARLIREIALTGYPLSLSNDSGGQPLGPLLSFAGTVVPACTHVIRHDGRWFSGKDYTVYFSNPDCPETYAAEISNYPASGDKTTPTLGTSESGIVQGIATIDIPPDMGTIAGFVSAGDSLLVLCQEGAWRVLRLGDGITYGYAREPFTLGCVSESTIANTPYGAFWLSEQGVVRWDGQHVPELVTADVLDTENSDTAFATTLNWACAAFHFRRNQYICVVPKASGQFILVVQADMPMRRGVSYSIWTHNLASDITGIGYDFNSGEVIYKSSSSFYKAADDTYTENSSAYEFGIEAWLTDDGSGSPVEANPTIRVTTLREYVAGEQTITVTGRGAPMPDEAAGNSRSKDLTLEVNEREKDAALLGVSGECLFVSVKNTDTHPLTLMALDIFNAGGAGQTERANA